MTALLVFTVYLAVDAAGLLGFRGRRRTIGLVAAHLVLPLAGLVLGAFLLLALLAALLGARDSRMGPTVVLFCLVVLAADALAVIWMGGWRPRVARPPINWPRRGAQDKGSTAMANGGGKAEVPAAIEGAAEKQTGRAKKRAGDAGGDAESAGPDSGGADGSTEPTGQ